VAVCPQQRQGRGLQKRRQEQAMVDEEDDGAHRPWWQQGLRAAVEEAGAGGGSRLMTRGSSEWIRGEAGRCEGGYLGLLRLGFGWFDEPFVQS